MFDLNYLLLGKGIHVPDVRVLVMRHVPSEPELRKALPWLAAEMPETYNVYQQFQRPHVERQLTEVRYVVSCVGYRSNEALFVGVYKLNSYKPVSFDEYWNVPENERLRSLGMRSWSSERDRPLPIGDAACAPRAKSCRPISAACRSSLRLVDLYDAGSRHCVLRGFASRSASG